MSTTEGETEDVKNTSWFIGLLKDGLPARYVLALLAFFGFVLNYMLRVNMSIAIVAMVHTKHSGNSSTNGSVNSQETDGPFEWNEHTQSLILGSFFWGYIVTQMPGGRLAEMFGSKFIFGLSILFSGIVTVLIPFAAEESAVKLICLRILLGIFEGATYPSMHAMLARWAPPLERSRFTSLVYSGSQAGTVLAFPLGGFIIAAWGWRAVFYVMGSLPIIWFVLWLFFAYESPQTHPRISLKERQYLVESISAISLDERKSLKVPWLQIATSKPFWGIIAASLASNWGFWTLLVLLPTYMKNILQFDIKANSILSAVPYVTMWVFGVSYSLLADYTRRQEKFSTGAIRKISAFFCLALPAVALFGVTFVQYRPIATVVIFTFAVGMAGAKYSSYLTNHIDIAPNFAGTLLGIANSFSTLPGWISPMIAAALLNGQQTLEQWHKVFYIASTIYLLGFALFVLLGSGEVQSWNNIQQNESDMTANRSLEDISSCSNTDVSSSPPTSVRTAL